MRQSERSGVYTITCTVTRMVYVGSSRHVPRRKAAHFYHLRKGSHHCNRLQRDFTTYGQAAFEFHAFLFPPDRMRREEQRGIAHYREAGMSYNSGNVVSVEPRTRPPVRSAPPPRPRLRISAELRRKWRDADDARQRTMDRLIAKLPLRR